MEYVCMVTICEDVSGEDLYHDISLLKYHMRYHGTACVWFWYTSCVQWRCVNPVHSTHHVCM